uniref:NADH-ubiquinone oxidoreductase chain 6 n=1 Tax=Lytta caraganae TaxID=1850555 RepID=A0A1L2DXF7_9CUCU|nr:NADH dehydrogenase subunit 6 [Lytta caraganae]ANG08419.1 NADH dehydrogenase subunit 6 [Lytta caraganae]
MSLFMLNITFSAIFISLTHPLSLGLILLIQTTIISLVSGKFCMNFWFSYILFLIMIGGMLILFIYMTSIASNEKFSFKFKSLAPIFVIFSSLTISPMLMFLPDMNIKNDLMNFNTNYLEISMIKYTYFPMNIMLMFMIIYLFITLIAIVKIIDTKNGPLRPKN